MRARSIICWSLPVTLALTTGGPVQAQSQLLPSLFPEGVPGYDTAMGVTVQSRLHPDLTPLGLGDGAFKASPSIDETIGYNSNLLPGAPHHGSWQVTTAPALIFGSDWPRNQLGAAINLQNSEYLSLPAQNQTNGSVAAGGRLDIGQDQLTVAASHTTAHEISGQINTLASTQPIAVQIDDARVSYRLTDGAWNLTPSLDAAYWSYGNGEVGGLPSSQAYRDRVIGRGDLTLRYEWAPLRNLLFVVRALNQSYTSIPTGQPTTNSSSYQFLAGLDYDDNSVWRWRLLLGGESRQFAAPVYAPQNTMIAEAEAVWQPSGMTTVHALLSRDTEDAAQEGVSGLTYSAARLTIDHECLRNLLLKASIGLQQADYFQGGRQTGYTAGAGITWILNRSMRLTLTYDQADLRGGQSSSGTLSTGYNRSLSLLTLHFGL